MLSRKNAHAAHGIVHVCLLMKRRPGPSGVPVAAAAALH
jgi:hypothetical protein